MRTCCPARVPWATRSCPRPQQRICEISGLAPLRSGRVQRIRLILHPLLCPGRGAGNSGVGATLVVAPLTSLAPKWAPARGAPTGPLPLAANHRPALTRPAMQQRRMNPAGPGYRTNLHLSPWPSIPTRFPNRFSPRRRGETEGGWERGQNPFYSQFAVVTPGTFKRSKTLPPNPRTGRFISIHPSGVLFSQSDFHPRI